MQRFEYLKAASLEQAISFLAAHQGEAKLLAGGTDLIPYLKEDSLSPGFLVDLKAIPSLDTIRYDGDDLCLGALSTIRAIETAPLLLGSMPLDILAQAAGTLGSVQVRNRATIGGNLCNASPSADMAPALLALEARLQFAGPAGTRSVPLTDFFTGPKQTVVGPDEVMTEIRIPRPENSRTAGVYVKLSPRGAMDLAIVGIAAVVSTSTDGAICSDIRIGLGGVAPTPIRARQTEAVLRGKRLDDSLVDTASKAAVAECSPISDVRGSAEYRRAMVTVLTGRAIRQAWTAANSI